MHLKIEKAKAVIFFKHKLIVNCDNIFKAPREFVNRACSENKKVLQEIEVNDEDMTNAYTICNCFNENYSSTGKIRADKIKTSPHFNINMNNTNNTMYLSENERNGNFEGYLRTKI